MKFVLVYARAGLMKEGGYKNKLLYWGKSEIGPLNGERGGKRREREIERKGERGKSLYSSVGRCF